MGIFAPDETVHVFRTWLFTKFCQHMGTDAASGTSEKLGTCQFLGL